MLRASDGESGRDLASSTLLNGLKNVSHSR